jgi:hypothetical protein
MSSSKIKFILKIERSLASRCAMHQLCVVKYRNGPNGTNSRMMAKVVSE